MTERNKQLTVTLVCHSDLLGGAAVVTYRLMQALAHEGVRARMLVFTKITSDPDVAVVGSRSIRGIKFMAERARIMLANGFNRDDLFKVSIANTGYAIDRHPWVRESDVVVLSWINQGMMSLSDIRRLAQKKPVVWTMHDMWCLTGICHHAHDCTRYRGECGCCPFLHSSRPNDLSHTVWQRKKDLYSRIPVKFVAVSNWLADRCAESSLMHGADVEVIHNAFPVGSFFTEKVYQLDSYGVDPAKSLILMGAARLDDPIKGFSYAVEALNHIFDNYPKVARDSQAVFFGAMRNPEALDELRFPHVWVGRVNDPRVVRALYGGAKVVISSSLYETLPSTLIEGQASGCLPVSFGRGGQADIITHLKDGYIARPLDTVDLAEGIMWALSQKVDRKALQQSVTDRFGSRKIALRYIQLFKKMLS